LSVDGAHLENVSISDITMENVDTPIFVRLGARLKTFRAGDEKRVPGVLRHVVLKNILAKAAETSHLTSASGIFITGIPDHSVEDFTLENVRIQLPGGGAAAQGRQVLEEKVDTYPEINRFAPCLPAYGLYARHVKGLTVKNLEFELSRPDARPALVCIDGEKVSVLGGRMPGNDQTESLIRFESVRDGVLRDVAVKGNARVGLRVEGKDSHNIMLESVRSESGQIEKLTDLAPEAANSLAR
jgi:hypothetical protein